MTEENKLTGELAFEFNTRCVTYLYTSYVNAEFEGDDILDMPCEESRKLRFDFALTISNEIGKQVSFGFQRNDILSLLARVQERWSQSILDTYQDEDVHASCQEMLDNLSGECEVEFCRIFSELMSRRQQGRE